MRVTLFDIVELRGNFEGRATDDTIINKGALNKIFRNSGEGIKQSPDNPFTGSFLFKSLIFVDVISQIALTSEASHFVNASKGYFCPSCCNIGLEESMNLEIRNSELMLPTEYMRREYMRIAHLKEGGCATRQTTNVNTVGRTPRDELHVKFFGLVVVEVSTEGINVEDNEAVLPRKREYFRELSKP
jgi:hypothetical protein